MNRYSELTPTAKTFIDELINAVAARPGWQESLALVALKSTRKADRKIVLDESETERIWGVDWEVDHDAA